MSTAALDKHPFYRPGQLRRAAPFLIAILIGFALNPIMPASESDPTALLTAGVLYLTVVAAVALLPWERMPAWSEVLPPLALLVVVALLHDDGSDQPSIYEALALVPIVWMALEGTVAQLIVTVVGAVLVFLVPSLVDNGELVTGDLWRSAFAITAGALLVVIIETLRVSQLRASSDERLRTVVDTMPDGLVVVDQQGRTILSNRYAQDLLSMEGGGAAVAGPIARMIAGEALEDLQVHVPAADGHAGRWIGVSTQPLQDLDGKPSGGVAVVWDITDQKRDEQYQTAQYRVSRALAQADSLEDAIAGVMAALGDYLDLQLGIFWQVEVRPVMSRSIGRPVRVLRYDRLWARPGLDVTHFERVATKLAFSSPIGLLGRVWDSGEPGWETELDGGGSERIAAAVDLGMTGSVCVPVTARDRVLGVIEFFTTDLRGSPSSLRGVLTGVGAQLGEFIERKRAEQEADRDKDAFFGLVSHELRTPLTSIIGYLDLLVQEKGEQLDDDARHFVDIARRNSDRLLRLVGDLLLVAQVQTGRFSHEMAPVDLNSIASHCVEAARPIADARGVTLGFSGAPIPEFEGDADRLGQLFDNLISNAIKFTPEGERIEVRVINAGERAIGEVTNTGSYIPPEEGSRLFERFFRGSNASENVVQGVGLGLAIAKAIVDVHGGAIRYESNEGVGTTFRFWLPLEQPAAIEAGDASSD